MDPVDHATADRYEDGMAILPTKAERVAVTWRFPPGLLDEVRELAARQGYSVNEAAERFLTWATQRTREEILQEEQGKAKKK